MKQFSLQWDKDYGLLKKTGWTVTVDGLVIVHLKKSLLAALVLTWWRVRGSDDV